MKVKHEERMLAIWQTIQHWLEIYEKTINPNFMPYDLYTGSESCALCHYDSNCSNPTMGKTAPPYLPNLVTCMHCPIPKYSGAIECRDTPHFSIEEIIENYDDAPGAPWPDHLWNDKDRRILADLVALEYSFLVEVAFAEYEEISE